MANTSSAKKRIRQNVKRRARNRWRKELVKHAVRQFNQSVHDGDKGKAAEDLKAVYKQLDKIAAKGTIPNAANCEYA
ncbi:MAG: 30S ribosomal protein S20, partial [Phycisphaerae bacterium]|nr:30S ribosomal protein S20 [Phycisphaerae bacterium]